MPDADSSEQSLHQRLGRYLLTGWAGRQFDTIPELAMHAGIWMMCIGLGIVVGIARTDPFTEAAWIFTVGAIIGIAGQIAVEGGMVSDA